MKIEILKDKRARMLLITIFGFEFSFMMEKL
jgi:hypothetical protein